MMKIRTMEFLLKEGFYSIFKNRVMSLASIGTIAVCIFIIGISFCIGDNVDYNLKKLERNVIISAYIDENLNAEKVMDLKVKLLKNKYIKDVKYISKEEHFKRFLDKMSPEDRKIFEEFKKDNPLRHSFEITVQDAKYQETLVQQLKEIKELKKIISAKDAIKILLDIDNFIRITSLIFVIILSIISVILISNTIKLTVFIRKNEINIMKYVGATDWFIRWPFVIEGMLIGFLGTVIPLVAILFSYDMILQGISTYTKDVLYFRNIKDIFNMLVPFSCFIGMGIGTTGSVISIRKHLKV